VNTTYADIQNKLAQFLLRQKQADRTGGPSVNRETYLDLIEGIVGYFRQYQDERGCILDPVFGEEKQYSTPSYAAAAACLVRFRGREDLLRSACDALTFSLESMVAARCNNHGNFYTVMVVHAYLWLEPLVAADRRDEWKRLFASVDISKTYRQAYHNWSIVAQAGEAMRLKYGLGGDLEEIDRNLELQIPLITELGMYVDPNGPIAYDQFSRLFFRMMLNHGYSGRFQGVLSEYSRRGAVTSLFLQSPTGEILLGGRSAQHQWNEAEQCYIFESYANFFAGEGDMALAGAFKRAAKLSLASITRWVRPSGELNIVRNRYEPAERVGYEGYSFHSQYNLLAAFMLAAAYTLADDAIADLPCPAELGGFAIHLGPHFRKVVLNAGGYYVVVQTKGEPNYNPTGIIRIQKLGCAQPIGPADMVPLKGKTEGAISYAVQTEYRGKIQRLADLTKAELDEVYVKIEEESAQRCAVSLTYIGGLSVNRFQRTIVADERGVTVHDELPQRFVEEIPVFLFDGQEQSSIEVASRKATVRLRDELQTVTILSESDEGLTLTDRSGLSRNGKIGCLQYETKGTRTSYRVELTRKERD
jgi:hypothetical protein